MDEPESQTQSQGTEETPADRFKGRRYSKHGDEELRTITVKVPVEVHNGVEKLAFLNDRNVRDYLRLLLRDIVAEAINDDRIRPGAMGEPSEPETEEASA